MSQHDHHSRKIIQNDVLIKYHTISVKLKKRFLRKPNVAEAGNQFEILAIECEQNEILQYAAMCWLAAARCQGTLGNISAEINLLIKAGRLFIIEEKKSDIIGCSTLGQENLQAAINCFGHALTRCQSQENYSVLSAGLAIELGSALKSRGVHYLQKALDIHPCLLSMNTLACYYIKECDYVSALQILTELFELASCNVNVRECGVYNSSLQKSEVTRVLLLLILQPSPQRLASSQAQVLEKYAWLEDDSNTRLNMNEDQMLLLQSLVLACQSCDYQAVLDLEGELSHYLNTEQKGLLNKLVQTLTR